MTAFTDPVGTAANLVITPVVGVGVALSCVVFWIGGKLGLNKVIDWASDKWADGYSMPNWVSVPVLLATVNKGRVLKEKRAVRSASSTAESRLVWYGKHRRAPGSSSDPSGRRYVHLIIYHEPR